MAGESESVDGTYGAGPGEVLVIGDRWSPRVHEVKDFLARNLVPYVWRDVEEDDAALELAARIAPGERRFPIVRFPDGHVVARPDITTLAGRIGLDTRAESPFYDLIIVGAGPAGLAAAVYGASEGLHTAVVEREAPGGQAGQSARIENYLGFPEGLSGADLGRRAVAQAEKFGAELLVTRCATGLRAAGPYRLLSLDDGSTLACHAVLIATGVSYRFLDAPGCPELVGRGIYYGAASTEAEAFRGQDVYLLGGGNSAGQAAVLLADYARCVTMLMLEDSLDVTMSQYLHERIDETENIVVRTGATVCGARGADRLEEIVIQDAANGSTERVPATGLFVFIGAKPRTEWLGDAVTRDEAGFIRTGPGILRRDSGGERWPLERRPHLLETVTPGVFAAGDVRSGSIKRLASAVGEGAMAISFVHAYESER
ncbi:MAG TPA: FAD-dependent oxidoreductase [Gemmatimonadales bacterium]